MIYTICSNCGKEIEKGTKCDCKKESTYKRFSIDNIKFTSFYNSPEWKKLRDYISRYYAGMCLMCLMEHKRIVPQDVAHHIEEIRDNWNRRLDKDNLIPLCHGCHNAIHKEYNDGVKSKLIEYKEEYERIYK